MVSRSEKSVNRFSRAGIVVCAVLALASCATGPRVVRDPVDEFAMLDSGALVYVSADIPQARPILDRVEVYGLDQKTTAQVISRTESAVAGVYPPGSSRTFLLIAQGRYPKGQVDFSFALSRYWKRASAGGHKYWRAKSQTMSVAVERNRAMISNGELYAGSGGVEVPPAFAAMRLGAAATGWLPNGGTVINSLLTSMELPLQIPAELILFSIYQVEASKYEGLLRLETPSASQARGIVTMLSLARALLGGGGGEMAGAASLIVEILLANPAIQDGNALLLRTNPMDSQDLGALITGFLQSFEMRY